MKAIYVTTPDDYKLYELEQKKAKLVAELGVVNEEIAELKRA